MLYICLFVCLFFCADALTRRDDPRRRTDGTGEPVQRAARAAASLLVVLSRHVQTARGKGTVGAGRAARRKRRRFDDVLSTF